MTSGRSTKNITAKSSRFHAAPRGKGKRKSRLAGLPWRVLLFPGAVLYFVLLIQVETVLSSKSRHAERLEAMRDSLRAEVVLASAVLDERLCLESLVPMTDRQSLDRVLPDQAVVVPGRDAGSEPELLTDMLLTVVAGIAPSHGRVGDAEEVARRTLAAVGLP